MLIKMKKIILFSILLSFLFANPLLAGELKKKNISRQNAATADPCSNCEEDFEGVGAPSASWTAGGGNTPNWDYSSSGLSMCNSEVVHMDAQEHAKYDPSYAANSQYWTFKWRYTNGFDADNRQIVGVFDSSDTLLGSLRVDANETVECVPGDGTAVSGSTLNTGQTYHFKAYVSRNTGGNNGTVTLWIWNGSSWDQDCTSGNGTRTGTIDYIEFKNREDAADEDQYIDCFRDSPTDITEP